MISRIVNQTIFQPRFKAAPPDFTPADMSIEYEDVWLQTSDSIRVSAWHLKAPNPRGAVLYLHGNAGDRRDWAQAAPEFIWKGYNLFILDYRGYGVSEGKPTEKGIYLDGEAAWVWLAERSRQQGIPAFILGKSLGSSVATHLGTRYSPAGLILDSAFTSVKDLTAIHARWLPRFLAPTMLDSLCRVGNITCPTLVIHGKEDDLVPVAHGQMLYQALRSPKSMLIIEGAGHNTIDAYETYFIAVVNFMNDPIRFITAAQGMTNENLLAQL